MQRKVLGIIIVDFEAGDHIFYIRQKRERKNGHTMKQPIGYL